MTSSARAAAITGAGSGLGREIALGLAAKGYRVFGTAISEDEVDDLGSSSAGAVTLMVCGITDGAAVTAWVSRVSDALGEGGLDLLVSNAGILTPGPLEVIGLDEVRREFEVNVFGGLAVINAFLPALRKIPGRIVEIGAMTGRFPIPFNGPSSASKAALEAFADVYRAELKPFGVDLVLVQAGNMRTGGPAKTAAALERRVRGMTAEQRALYGEAFTAFAIALNGSQATGIGAAEAAAQVIAAAEQVPAPIRVALGDDAAEILRMVREKSDAELDIVRLQLTGLDHLGAATANG